MDWNAHFLKMFAYDFWANDLFIRAMETQLIAHPKVYILMSHILSANEIWLCRVQNRPAPDENLWKPYTIQELREKAVLVNDLWKNQLTQLNATEINSEVIYQNSKGQKFSSSLIEILTHLINHGTYHRGQLASLFRQEGVIPPVTDFIAYIREKKTSV